jgi:hypothetical protein
MVKCLLEKKTNGFKGGGGEPFILQKMNETLSHGWIEDHTIIRIDRPVSEHLRSERKFNDIMDEKINTSSLLLGPSAQPKNIFSQYLKL